MSLFVFEYDEDNNTYKKISEDGVQTNPIQTTHDGTNGQIVEKKLFIKNDDSNTYLTALAVQAMPESKVKIGGIDFPEAYIGYKLFFKETQPSKSEWASVLSGNEMFIDNVGDTDEADLSYKPFWIQVTIPQGVRVGALRDVYLQITAEENPLGT